MDQSEDYEVYAIRYATDPTWPRWKSYVHIERPEERIRMDFFSWVAISKSRAFVIDTGCSEQRLRDMRHEVVANPVSILKDLGVGAASVDDLIISHLHYDHVGTADQFPNATMHLQLKELAFATGPYMRFRCFSRAYFPEDIQYVVAQVHNGKVRQYDGSRDLAPGISIHLVGGHTMGMQIVRIMTKRGWIVLASDALHYYSEVERDLPWSSNAFSVGDMMDAHDTIRSLAASMDHIIPAHDPLVMEKYPAASESLRGLAVRLHEAPRAIEAAAA